LCRTKAFKAEEEIEGFERVFMLPHPKRLVLTNITKAAFLRCEAAKGLGRFLAGKAPVANN
jgi:hypothetical protein